MSTEVDPLLAEKALQPPPSRDNEGGRPRAQRTGRGPSPEQLAAERRAAVLEEELRKERASAEATRLSQEEATRKAADENKRIREEADAAVRAAQAGSGASSMEALARMRNATRMATQSFLPLLATVKKARELSVESELAVLDAIAAGVDRTDLMIELEQAARKKQIDPEWLPDSLRDVLFGGPESA